MLIFCCNETQQYINTTIFYRLYRIVIFFKSSSLKIGELCTAVYTVGYGYSNWYNATEIPTADGTVMFKFYVQAASDAHVMLAREPLSFGYEIVLGGGSNSFCDIRKFKGLVHL